ncbi:coatomer subunit gamma, putative [Plasmodium vinckei lentum]|uniref:Coatomer subunit gamma n=1 Tax=Plasmodium vinckei lentum TaxID=138297 RepID=A0A6V7S5M2_PLAVN|nr:coatomer subunit gamma, putative [Plasmodium vinckei lentum]
MIIKDKVQRNLLKDSRYEDEKFFVNPHDGDKANVLQETRVFSSYPLNIQKCLNILTKILYLINKNEASLTSQECTEIFFSITKLFQSNNERLRRMVYLVIKSLPVSEKEVFIVTSSLTKDMNSSNDCYRANAIRVLSQTIDSLLAAQIERYLKTAIVDKNPFVSSSALLCGLNLFINTSSDIVKRWINEVSECINSKHPMIQFHALTLLCSIKYNDKLALEKIISSYGKRSSNLTGSLANCLLIKYAAHLIYHTEIGGDILNANNSSVPYSNATPNVNNPNNQTIHPTTKVCFDFLKLCLKSKDTVVLYEAVKSIVELATYDLEGRNSTTIFNVEILTDCLKVCKLFLLSTKTIEKFCIIRKVNKLSHYRPMIASKLNEDIEALLTDENKNICVLAFTTLLKTGNEQNIDELLNQINTYMNSDNNSSFKIQIIQEVKNLCFIYPNKSKVILNFLSNNLRDEESYKFKSTIIDTIILIITQIPNSEENAILQLCEFIEDCEYNSLLLRVIRFLLLHIPKTKKPSKYIRYIYNRLILESSTIRADGMYALFYIALKCQNNSKDILFLLKCLLVDSDDEVRDRTNLFYHMLKEKIQKLDEQVGNVANEKEGSDGNEQNEEVKNKQDTLVNQIIFDNNYIDVEKIIAGISNHMQNDLETEFDHEQIKDDVLYTTELSREGLGSSQNVYLKKKSSYFEMQNNTSNMPKFVEHLTDQAYIENVSPLVDKYNMGSLKLITKHTPLTETEAEYTVFVKKYIYLNYIVLGFTINNTLNDQILSDVNLQINSYEKKWAILEKTTIKNIYYNQPQNLYILLKKNIPFNISLDSNDPNSESNNNNQTQTEQTPQTDENDGFDVSQSFQCSLHFYVKENEMDDGYPDSYSINNMNIQITDFINACILRNSEFKLLWDNMSQYNSECTSKFSLNFENIQAAVTGLLNNLNMSPCDNTNIVEPNSNTHNMLLYARFLNQTNVLCMTSLIISQQYGCLLKIISRSTNKHLSEYLIKSLE